MFTQWDGLWYLEIVRNGYPRSIPANITYFQLEARAAFFPLYPMLVRDRSTRSSPAATRSPPWSQLHARRSAPSCSSAYLARRLYDTDVAERAMVLFAVFPGSFVLSYAYAEALLIVLAALCLWFLLDERWLLAGVAAALATATRPNGIALVAACAVAALIAIQRRRDWSSLIAPLAGPDRLRRLPDLPGRPHRRVAGRGSACSARRGGRAPASAATAISNTLSFFTHPLASPTDALTAVSMAALAARPVVPVAQAPAVADDRLHRRGRRC